MTGRCQFCPATEAQVCPGERWSSGCRVIKAAEGPARDWLLASMRRQIKFIGSPAQPTAAEMLAIELCSVRSSDCNCLGKPATCRRDEDPVVVICLEAGPDGGVCPGVAVAQR